jgi:hypothetical protein
MDSFAAILVVLLALLYVLTSSSGSTNQASPIASILGPFGGLGLLSSNSANDTGVQVYNSDSSLTGSPITNDPTTWPGDDKLWNICAAVALAEGYNLGEGTAPYDLNNPGDLSPGDEDGQRVNGSQFHGGSSIIVFDTAEGGWTALYSKFSRIVNGQSTVYPKSWSWSQVAAKYAGNSTAWLNNVTSYLGVDPTSTPAQYVNS